MSMTAALVGALAAAAGQAAGDYGGTLLGNYFSKKSQRRASNLAMDQMALQYSLAQRSLKESPTNARIGMERAGFNPLLAVGNGIGNAPTSFGAGFPSSSFSGGSSLIDGKNLGDQIERMLYEDAQESKKSQKLNNDLIEKNIEKTEAQTNEANANAIGKGVGAAAAGVGAAAMAKKAFGKKGVDAVKAVVGGGSATKAASRSVLQPVINSGKSLKAVLPYFGSQSLLSLPALPALWSIKKGYDKNKDDPKKMLNFVKALRLGAM